MLSGVVILMGIITAETRYPRPRHDSTFTNEISDLGATLPPHTLVTEPSGHIFDLTMVVSGGLLIAAAVCLHNIHRSRLLTWAIALWGVGVMGAGVFPNTHHAIHESFSLIAFLFGGLACVLSSGVTRAPFRVLALLFGATSLLFLLSGHTCYATLGRGGVERWIAYPIVLWMVGYGGYTLPGIDATRLTATRSAVS